MVVGISLINQCLLFTKSRLASALCQTYMCHWVSSKAAQSVACAQSTVFWQLPWCAGHVLKFDNALQCLLHYVRLQLIPLRSCQLALLSLQLFTGALIANNVTGACVQHVLRPLWVAKLGSNSLLTSSCPLHTLFVFLQKQLWRCKMAVAKACASLQGLYK